MMLSLMLLMFAETTTSAEAHMARLDAAFRESTYQEYTFTQTRHLPVISRPLVSTGRLIHARDHGLIWDIIEPMQVRTRVTAEGIFKTTAWQDNERVTDHQMQAVSDLLVALLDADRDALEARFEVTLLPTEPGQWQIGLTPRQRLFRRVIARIELRGREPLETQGIEAIQIEDANGQRTLLDLQQRVRSTAPLTDAQQQLFR